MPHRTSRFAPSFALVAAALAMLCGCGDLEDEPATKSAAALQVCAAGATVPGIDVSVYQDGIDWQRVKAAGVQFAVARVSNGTQVQDTFFDANWAGIKAAGLIRGAYQYFQPGQDAAAQAELVVSKVGRLGPGDLPVQLDMEVTGGKPASAIVDQMRIWIDRVTAGTGKRPLIYSGRYFWDDNVGSKAFGSYPLWVANYGVKCPNLPAAWSSWTIWQHSDTGRVAGIDGNVDLDWFNGTVDDLRRFADGGGNGAVPARDGGPEAGTITDGGREAGTTTEGGPQPDPDRDAGSPQAGDSARDAAPANDYGVPADGAAEAGVTDAAARDAGNEAATPGGEQPRADGGALRGAATRSGAGGCASVSAPVAGGHGPLTFTLAAVLLVWPSRRRRARAPTAEKHK